MESAPQVRWMAARSGAGGTTLTQILARDHGLRVDSTDDAIRRHALGPAADTPLASLPRDEPGRPVGADGQLLKTSGGAAS